MLSRGLLLRVYWEIMKEGNNNNSDCMSFTENSRHIAMKIFMNATLFDVQNVGNCISEDLDFTLFCGIIPPAPLH